MPPEHEQEVSAITSSDSGDTPQQAAHLHLDHANSSSQQLSYELVKKEAEQKHVITERLGQAEENAQVAELNHQLKQSRQYKQAV